MDLVSIIIPVYNVDRYLKNCVEALCSQTYNNIEIILVDDGSTDNSGWIADDLAKKDNRIKTIHTKNSGAGFARNTGLEVASGKYVTFVDSDDYVENNLIELLMLEIKKGSDVSIGGFKRIDERGHVIGIEEYNNQNFAEDAVYSELFSRMLGSSPKSHDAIKMAVWNAIYSMDIIRKYNLRFPSQKEYYSEDLYFNYLYFKKSRKASLINSTAYGYRVTPGSLTQKYKPQLLESVSSFYSKMEKELKDYKMVIRLQRQFFVNIRACIRQENAYISGKSPKAIEEAIKNIVNNPTVNRVANSYFKCIKQFKQKIFVYLVKNKRINILYLVVKYKLI